MGLSEAAGGAMSDVEARTYLRLGLQVVIQQPEFNRGAGHAMTHDAHTLSPDAVRRETNHKLPRHAMAWALTPSAVQHAPDTHPAPH